MTEVSVGPVLLMAGGFAVAVALGFRSAVYDWVADRRRGRMCAQYCLERGFEFERERPGEERRHAATCAPVFGEGHGQRWGLTITGTYRGSPFTAFEFAWITGPEPSRHSKHLKIGGILWPVERQLPQFMLTPKGLSLDDSPAVYWYPSAQDIDFDDSPDFSSAYRLQGGDEAAVRALWTPELRHTFAREPSHGVAAGPAELLWWRTGSLPSPKVLDQFLTDGNRILQLLRRP